MVAIWCDRCEKSSEVADEEDPRCACGKPGERLDGIYDKAVFLCLDAVRQCKLNILPDDGEPKKCCYCEGRTRQLADAERSTCDNVDCEKYLSANAHFDLNSECTELVKGHPCRAKAVVLDSAGVQNLPTTFVPVDRDRDISSSERRLQSELHNAERFLASSGTHHKDKSGQHTASATERHTDADRGARIAADEKINHISILLAAVPERSQGSWRGRVNDTVNRLRAKR